MSVPEYLARAQGRVDLDRLAEVRVVVFGVGTVGSAVVKELANCGIRRFRLIDGDNLEVTNLSRGELKHDYVGRNKAESMADLLRRNYPPEHLEIQYYPCFVDGAMSDDFLDRLIEDADLVIAATDQRPAQRRVAGRAVAFDIPAVFPALHEASGEGEVFVCRGVRDPCLLCWESFRTSNQDLRAVAALNVEAVPVIAVTVELALGLLDTDSVFARRWFPLESARDRHPTLFLVQPGAPSRSALVHWRENCSMCPVGSAERTESPAANPLATFAPREFVRRRPGVSVLGALTVVSVIVALATGSGVAVFVCTAMTLGTLYALLLPDASTLRRIRATGGAGVPIGALLLGLFIAGISTGNRLVTAFMLTILVIAALLVARRPPT